ncbi:hypothetical protein GA0070616_0081 [Micromonospora nigra]|uniref:Uncharacterized protein n=1 Tax=Micromonospora nigra TaxID=145857 RepID=A0A1C6R7G7_9ACTN|nr:hypothetical protein [Micromonospora nigra]SCL12964.1 hypothetical protein GA0070616_0081 [Micromonospora nigra]
MPQRRGARLGAPQKGNPPQYDASSGGTWRPNPTIEPANAAKLNQAMKAMGTSASAVINELLARMPVDEDGLPVWATRPTEQASLVDLPHRASYAA